MGRSQDAIVQVSTAEPGVCVITLNLPDMRNAMTQELTAAWTDAIRSVAADHTVRVVVVTGAGSSFCSGADLSWLDQASQSSQTPFKLRERMIPFYEAWLSPRRLEVPVIAAINGPAVGAGLCLALACDLRYAHASAIFSAPFLHLGTHGGMAVTTLLPEAVGVPRAREMLYTGREVPAAEALEWGLVNGVVDGDVLDHAVSVARTVAQAAPIATKLTKAGLEQATEGLAASLRWEALAQPVTMNTADIHEGVQARREHRQPDFSGR